MKALSLTLLLLAGCITEGTDDDGCDGGFDTLLGCGDGDDYDDDDVESDWEWIFVPESE